MGLVSESDVIFSFKTVTKLMKTLNLHQNLDEKHLQYHPQETMNI